MGDQDWEAQIRSQVSRIVEEIGATPPSAPRTSGSLSFEDIVSATARAVVPALLVDLPLELERLLGRVLEDGELPADDRVQLLRVIIARLSAEWAGLAEKLVERLDQVGARDPQSKARVHERIAQQFRAGLLSTVVLGDAAPAAVRDGSFGGASPVLPAEALAERMAGVVARKVDDSITPLRSVLDEWKDLVSEATADRVVTEMVSRVEEASGRLAETAARRVVEEGKADPSSAEELRSLLRAEIQDALGKVPPPAFRPDEIQTIASHIVHSLGASLTSMLFGPPMGREEPKSASRPSGKTARAAGAKKPSPKKPAPRQVRSRRR